MRQLIRKRKGSENWYTAFKINGVSKSLGTTDPKKAERLAAKWYHEVFESKHFDTEPEFYWEDAVVQFLKESKKKSMAHDKSHLRWLDPHLRGMQLKDISRKKLVEIRNQKLSEGAKESTANRYMGLIRTILMKAHREWEDDEGRPWLSRVPKPPITPETPRERYLSREEFSRLVSYLPDYFADVCRFAVSTGLRKGNIINLCWEQVNLERKYLTVRPENSKSGKGIGIPLSEEACEVLWRQIGKHPTHVFTRQGVPVGRATGQDAWKRALKQAGIHDFRFHDLRHTWASWMRQKGVPEDALQRLGAWQTRAMVGRYTHMGVEELREYV